MLANIHPELLSFHLLSKNAKIRIYIIIILLVVLLVYGRELGL
jgi:hypothetical protein